MLLISYLLKRKRKIFLLYFAIRRRNEGVVTYGIRDGSTRELGFTTDVLNTIGVLGVLLLICVLIDPARIWPFVYDLLFVSALRLMI